MKRYSRSSRARPTRVYAKTNPHPIKYKLSRSRDDNIVRFGTRKVKKKSKR